MGLEVCAPEPFVGTQQFQVPFGSAIITLTNVHLVSWQMDICRRPALPLWGLSANAAPYVGTYDFALSTKGNEQTFLAIAKSALQASTNFVNDVTVGDDIYTGQYGSYLYRKTKAAQCLIDRYLELHYKAAQFFKIHAAIGAFNTALWQELHDSLIPSIQREADKQLFLPPGSYRFSGASLAKVALDAWQIADANFVNLFGIEVITT